MNKNIIIKSKIEHTTAKEKLIGLLKSKWLEKKAKEDKQFKGRELLDDEEL